MAWRSSGTSNTSLVAALARNQLLKSEDVIRAFQVVDRHWFVPPPLHAVAFEDRPLPIGYGVTISAPHMHAIMAEHLAPYVRGTQKRVLDIGSGSGFLTCVLTALSDASSRVIGVDHVPELIARSSAVAAEHFPEWQVNTPEGRLTFICGNGLHLDSKTLPFDTFDAIHVGAAAPHLSKALVSLLAPGGCLVIPVGAEHDTQVLYIIRKRDDGTLETVEDSLVQFVPLTSLDKQLLSGE